MCQPQSSDKAGGFWFSYIWQEIIRGELSVIMSALEVPEVDDAVFTEDEDDYDDEEGKSNNFS